MYTCVCERAERASLENFGIFTFLNCHFFQFFCRYITYFVGTNDMLVGLHVPTNFQMYRQKSEKALLGGGGGPAPPPPSSGYASAIAIAMSEMSQLLCASAQLRDRYIPLSIVWLILGDSWLTDEITKVKVGQGDSRWFFWRRGLAGNNKLLQKIFKNIMTHISIK